jgi:DNA polymerase
VLDEVDDELERASVMRSIRQHLESLGRAGLDRIPGDPALEVIGVHMPSRSRSNAPRELVRPAREAEVTPKRLTPPDDLPPAAPPEPVPPASQKPAPRTPRHPKTAQPVSTASLFGASGFETPLVPPEERLAILDSLATEVASCQKCPHLAAARHKTVFGTGSPTTRLMFIGEAPGADEDRTGFPFVGRAGQLLTDMITKGMGLTREQVYIANILKCRPPENRQPTFEESGNCIGYLERQIATIRPEFLCCLGLTAASRLLDTSLSMGLLRGKWHRYRGILTLVTYHPSYLLRQPSAKKDAWADLQLLMREMGLKIPARDAQTRIQEP